MEETSNTKMGDEEVNTESIDRKRKEIENLELTPVEITSGGLREKIRQKWSKIHFYVQDGNVVKIKTYPYETISKRTEEFYTDGNSLILVVIEDNGEGEKGKEKDQLDKMYYFKNENLVKELSNNQETEHRYRNSDAEELLAEYKEYLEIYTSLKK